MSTRLAQVLRAGKARGVSVHDNAIKVADLDDDVLRLITKAIGDADAEAACLVARNWCSLNPRHRGMCKGGGDALWTELTRHIFGAPAVDVKGSFLTSEEHFYLLCKMHIGSNLARRWMREHHFDPPFVNESEKNELLPQLHNNLGEALQLIKNDAFKTSEKRLRLVELVSSIYHMYSDDFRPAQFLDVNELYKMVDSGQDAEIDAALKLLDDVANDFFSMRPRFDEVHDARDGCFDTSKIGLLVRLLEESGKEGNENKQRQKLIVSIWKGLTSKVEHMEYEVRGKELVQYARALVAYDVDKMLMEHYARRGGFHGVAGDAMEILANIPRRMNESFYYEIGAFHTL
tara:strand:+ start:100 stop:1137 length:1038 start_codon:yes stop_codon:yes gene_type:complete